MDLQELLDQYAYEYGELAEKIKLDILREIERGEDLGTAIRNALWNNQEYADSERELLENLFISAAAEGLGIDPDDFEDDELEDIRAAILDTPWTDDGITAQERLEAAIAGTASLIQSSVNAAILNTSRADNETKNLILLLLAGTLTEIELKSSLYKIRNSVSLACGGVPPKISADMDAARKGFGNGEKLEIALTSLQKELTAIGGIAIEHAVETALKEKAAYQLERIARTETARAWFDGYMARYLDDDSVFGFKWVLSPQHSIFDQCDVCANADFGYGKGVFPKRYVPSLPRHPHCLCSLTPVFKGEVDETAKFSPDGGRKYIRSLPNKEQIALFGKDGMAEFRFGGDWQGLLRGWDGFGNDGSRLKFDKNT